MPDVQPDDLIIKTECAEFLATIHLAEQRPNVNIALISLEEVMLGSLVNLMLRTNHSPIFICR